MEISSICPAVCPSAGQRGWLHEIPIAAKVAFVVAAVVLGIFAEDVSKAACGALIALYQAIG